MRLKKRFLLLTFNLFLIGSFTNSFAGGFSDFFEDTFNSIKGSYSGTEKATYTVDAQGRRYYIGGSARYTVPNTNIQLVSASPPKFSAGCGGISLSLGSLSYLGYDQLVNKLQTALRAAPALAVQLVISNLCEKCNSILSYLEEVSDTINKLNIDSCELAKNSVGAGMKLFGMVGEASVERGDSSDSFEELNKNKKDKNEYSNKYVKLIKDITKAFNNGSGVYDCAVISNKARRAECFSSLLGTTGNFPSGIYNAIAGLMRLEGVELDAIRILRAYTGDFIIDGKENKADYIKSECSSKASIQNISKALIDGSSDEISIYLGYLEKDASPPEVTCTEVDLSNFIDFYARELSNLYNKIKSGSSLTTTDYVLVDSISLPIYAYFKDLARLSYVSPEASDILKDELIKRVSRYLVGKVFLDTMLRVISMIEGPFGSLDVKIRDSEEAIAAYEDLKRNLRDIRKSLYTSYRELDKKYGEDFAKFEGNVKEAQKKVNTYLAKYYLKASYSFSQ